MELKRAIRARRNKLTADQKLERAFPDHELLDNPPHRIGRATQLVISEFLPHFHATKLLWDCASAVHGAGTAQAAKWAEHLDDLMQDGQVDRVIAEMSTEAAKPAPLTNRNARPHVQRTARDAVAYLIERKDDLEHPKYHGSIIKVFRRLEDHFKSNQSELQADDDFERLPIDVKLRIRNLSRQRRIGAHGPSFCKDAGDLAIKVGEFRPKWNNARISRVMGIPKQTLSHNPYFGGWRENNQVQKYGRVGQTVRLKTQKNPNILSVFGNPVGH